MKILNTEQLDHLKELIYQIIGSNKEKIHNIDKALSILEKNVDPLEHAEAIYFKSKSEDEIKIWKSILKHLNEHHSL